MIKSIPVSCLQRHEKRFSEFRVPLPHLVLVLRLYRWVTAAEKPRTIRNCWLQRRQIRGYAVPTQFCSAGFSSPARLLSWVDFIRLQLSLQLANCTETEFILPFWLGYANGRLLCCQLFIYVWPPKTNGDKRTPTDVVGDADLAEKPRPRKEGTNCWIKQHSPSISLKSWTRPPQKCFGTAWKMTTKLNRKLFAVLLDKFCLRPDRISLEKVATFPAGICFLSS